MPIIGTLPNNIQNGNTVDATPVMADFNFIVNQVNANANPTGTLTAPSGTRTLFHQAAAPVGWVTDATITDHTIQATSVTPGGLITTGAGYSSMFLSQWTTDGHALTIAELAAHTHTDSGHTHGITDPQHSHTVTYDNTTGGGAPTANGLSGPIMQNTGLASTGITVNSSTANITNTGSGTAHSHTKTFNVNYIQCLVAQKT